MLCTMLNFQALYFIKIYLFILETDRQKETEWEGVADGENL